MSENKDPSSWEAIIPPKKSILLDFSPESILKITSMSFSSIKSDDPCEVIAKINSLLVPDESTNDDKCDISQKNEIVFGTLVPKKAECAEFLFQFHPLDMVEVSNSGPNEIRLSGRLDPIDSEYLGFGEEEEEEEEEEEKNEKVGKKKDEKDENDEDAEEEKVVDEPVIDPDTIQSRFSQMAANQPPKPTPQKKKNKKKKKGKRKENDENENDNEDDNENENENENENNADNN